MLRVALTVLGIAAVIVGMLGFRGQQSKNRPWHVFWDMKYQPKYTAQAQSSFFRDGRTMRLPVVGTIAYTTPGYFADAGRLGEPDADAVRIDSGYYRGIGTPAEVEVEVDVPKLGADGKPVLDANKKPEMTKEKRMVKNFLKNVPQEAIERAGLGEVGESGKLKRLMFRGREQYNIHCAVCHGLDGYGGQGDQAHGVVGRRGMIGIANYHQDKFRQMADGEIFDTISNGKNSMSAYGHQIQVQDRWAIVVYVRALQLSQNAPELLPRPEVKP